MIASYSGWGWSSSSWANCTRMMMMISSSWWSHRTQMTMIVIINHHDRILHRIRMIVILIIKSNTDDDVIIMMIALYADDDDSHHDQNPNLLNLRTIFSINIVLPEVCCLEWIISDFFFLHFTTTYSKSSKRISLCNAVALYLMRLKFWTNGQTILGVGLCIHDSQYCPS